MNAKLTHMFKSARYFLGKHSPEILTGVGIAGMVTTTVLAVKATPKALTLINEEINRQNHELLQNAIDNDVEMCTNIEKLKPIDVIKVVWKPYAPAVATGIASVICLIGASSVSSKRNAALATAYALSERTLTRYRDKVVDVIGERKEKEIREQISQDEVNNKPVSKSQVIIASKGNTLFMDSISGRYFKSSLDKVNKVVNELNRQLVCNNYVSLNDFYYELGLDPIKTGDDLGWNVFSGLIEIDIDTCMAEDEPCIVINYKIRPEYEYDKLL